MAINSNQKGKRGEREASDYLTSKGYPTRRGKQYKGTSESPDVTSKLEHQGPSIHDLFYFEIKRWENVSIHTWFDEACKMSKGKIPVVMHRRNHQRWIATVSLVDLIKVIPDVKERDLLYEGTPKQVEQFFARELPTMFYPVVRLNKHIFIDKGMKEALEGQKKSLKQTLDDADAAAAPYQYSVVVHRKPFEGELWLATMPMDDFIEVVAEYCLEHGVQYVPPSKT